MNSGSPNCKSSALLYKPLGHVAVIYLEYAVSASSSSLFFFKPLLRSKQGLTGQCPLDFAVCPRNKNVYSTVPKGPSFYLRPESKLFVSEMPQGRISFPGYLLKNLATRRPQQCF